MRFYGGLVLAFTLALAGCGGSGSSGDDDVTNDSGIPIGNDPPELNPDISHLCDPGPNTRFISTTGDDGADGLSPNTAWKTVTAALSKLQAGQAGCLAPGTYREDPKMSRAGSNNGWISLVGLNPDRSAKLVGELQLLSTASFVRVANLQMQSSSRTAEALTILGAKDVQLINIEVVNSNKMWWNRVDKLLLRDSWIHHNVIGIDCTPGPCTNIAIVGTMVECSGYTMGSGAACKPATEFTFGGPNDGLGAEMDTTNWQVIRSVFRNNLTDGFDIKGSNIIVKDSLAYGNSGGGFKIWGGGMTRLENSLAFHNNNGFELQEAANAMYQMVNCTSADNHLAGLAVYQDNGNQRTTLLLRNNIFAGNTDGNTYDDDVVVTGAGNVYFAKEDRQVKGGATEITRADVAAGRTPDTMALAVDPKFVKPDSGNSSDYHLMAGSPAIDSGSADGAPMHDLEQKPRPSGAGVDRGAYEQ